MCCSSRFSTIRLATRCDRGSTYIDVPFDCGNAAYRKFEAFLEYPDGSLPYPHMCILVIGLDYAMKNAHRDKLGF